MLTYGVDRAHTPSFYIQDRKTNNIIWISGNIIAKDFDYDKMPEQEHDSYSQTFNQILSTFKFTDQNSRVSWNVSKQNLDPDELEVKNLLLTYNYPQYPTTLTPKLSINSLLVSSVSSNFAYTSGTCLGNKNDVVQPTCTFIYFLHKNNNIWNIFAESDKNLCEVLKTFPSDILTNSLKNYMGGCFPN
jgi:hypothetical protein